VPSGCNGLLALTIREYQRVRADSRHYVMIPGHQIAGIEHVVETRPGYVVARKLDQAGDEAASVDPRA
jgi:hypothetical protein